MLDVFIFHNNRSSLDEIKTIFKSTWKDPFKLSIVKSIETLVSKQVSLNSAYTTK